MRRKHDRPATPCAQPGCGNVVKAKYCHHHGPGGGTEADGSSSADHARAAIRETHLATQGADERVESSPRKRGYNLVPGDVYIDPVDNYVWKRIEKVSLLRHGIRSIDVEYVRGSGPRNVRIMEDKLFDLLGAAELDEWNANRGEFYEWNANRG